MEKRLSMLLVSLFLLVGGALAQTRVNGTVVSQEDGEPIIGATVLVVGTQVGTVTDGDGKFTITVPQGKKNIRFSYVGMESVEAAARPTMRIQLVSDHKTLDEVIVVAYGTQKRSAFTGSASQIKQDAIEAHVATNVTSALAGSTSGVQVTSTSGDPVTSEPDIRIRGIGSINASNKPLIILDGMPYDGPINAINPNDVASMTVLKDASSSAIYGARGANGVVLITTKKGRNQDAEIKFDAKWGSNSRLIPQYDVITDPGQYYETFYKQLYNSQIYAGKTAAEAYAYADATLFSTSGGLGMNVFTVPNGEKLIGTNFKLNPNATLGYSDGQYTYQPDDWYEETFHNSFRQEYNLSASGVTDRLNYYASVGFLKDGGIVNNSDMKRYTARVNADYQAKKWLKLTTNMMYAHTDANRPAYGTTWGSSGNLFYVTNNISPIYPLYVRDADGNIMYENGLPVYDSNQTNQKRSGIVGNAVRDNEVNVRKAYRDLFNGKFSAVITPIEGLTLSANVAVTFDNQRYNELASQFGSATATDGIAYVTNDRSYGVTNQYLAEYHTSLFQDTHHLNVLAGYEQYQLKDQNLWGQNDHLFDPLIGELDNAVGADSKQLGSYTVNYMTEGFLSRLQYDYLEKYFLNASYRRDASSRFADGHRWGNFYSLGAAWEMGKENFLKNVKWIDMLKLKASFGEQGNDNLLDYNGYTTYYPYSDRFTASYNSETGQYSIVMTEKGNEELTWETSRSFNVGVDFALFNNRLSGTVEYFSRKTIDMLYFKDTPLSSGIVTGYIPVNVGSMINKGVELNLDGTIIKTKDIEWSMNLNLTHYKNEILELDPSVSEEGIKESTRILKEGGSIYNAYMYKYAGVDKNTGKALYYKKIYETVTDEEGNSKKVWTGESEIVDDFSKLSTDDKYDLGSTLPKVYGGFGTTVRAFGFDLSAQFAFQLGGKIYDGAYQQLMHTQQSLASAWHKDAMDAWTPQNPNSDIPRLDTDYSVGQSPVDRFQISSNYLSLNNLMLGYTFPKNLIAPLTLSNLRVYVSGENLFVLTKRKGLDPRYNYGIGGYNSGSGLNGNNYSAMRTITAGVSVSF